MSPEKVMDGKTPASLDLKCILRNEFKLSKREGKGEETLKEGRYNPSVRSRNNHDICLKILACEAEGLLQEEMGNSVGQVWRNLKAR